MNQNQEVRITKVLQTTDDLLWSNYAAAQDSHQPVRSFLYIFPLHNGSLRVSEQEARFAFIHCLNKCGFRFCAEMPTLKLYRQKGRQDSPGSFDVGVFNQAFDRLLNCEFKGHGISSAAKTSFRVKKDIEKLLRDPGDGLWFHLFEGIDNKSLNKLLTVFSRDILSLQDDYHSEIQEKSIIFHLCVLRHRFSITRIFRFPSDAPNAAKLKSFFHVNYHVNRKELINIGSSWVVHRPEVM